MVGEAVEWLQSTIAEEDCRQICKAVRYSTYRNCRVQHTTIAVLDEDLIHPHKSTRFRRLTLFRKNEDEDFEFFFSENEGLPKT